MNPGSRSASSRSPWMTGLSECVSRHRALGKLRGKGKVVRKVIAIFLVIVFGAAIIIDLAMTVVFRANLSNFYTDRLDAWVKAGGPTNEIQSHVIPDCSKLAVSQAGPVESINMLFDREEYDFRSDVCFQVTVNRVYPQPRFQNPKMVAIVCDSGNDLFRKLCAQAGLRQNRP